MSTLFWITAALALGAAIITSGLLLLAAWIARGCPDVNGDPERDAGIDLDAADGARLPQGRNARSVTTTEERSGSSAASSNLASAGRLADTEVDPAWGRRIIAVPRTQAGQLTR